MIEIFEVLQNFGFPLNIPPIVISNSCLGFFLGMSPKAQSDHRDLQRSWLLKKCKNDNFSALFRSHSFQYSAPRFIFISTSPFIKSGHTDPQEHETVVKEQFHPKSILSLNLVRVIHSEKQRYKNTNTKNTNTKNTNKNSNFTSSPICSQQSTVHRTFHKRELNYIFFQ